MYISLYMLSISWNVDTYARGNTVIQSYNTSPTINNFNEIKSNLMPMLPSKDFYWRICIRI